MKKKILKISLSIILVFGLIIGGLTLYSFIQSKSIKYNESYKFFRIKFLVMEKNKENYTLDGSLPEHMEDFITLTDYYVGLEKKGNYYTLNLKENVNKSMYNKIVDYAFAKNNYDGEVVNDCIYNEKTGQIKIPAKYFSKNKEEETPIQIELMTRMTKKEIKNISVKATFKRIFTKKKTYKRNGELDTLNLQISKKIKAKNLNVYINNMALQESLYSYDSKTGNLEVLVSPIMIDKIDIKYDGIISNVLKRVSVIAGVIPQGGGKRKIWTFKIKPLDSVPKSGSTGNATLETMRYADADSKSLKVYRTPVYPYSTELKSLKKLQLNDFTDTDPNHVKAVVNVGPGNFNFKKAGKTPSNIYIYSSCAHVNSTVKKEISQVPGNYKWNYKITSVSEGASEVTFGMVMILDKSHVYSGTGSGGKKQTLSAAVKWKYKKTQTGKINVTKKLQGATPSDGLAGFKFRLYENSTCTEESDYDDAITDGNGNASWDEVDFGTYYIKEVDTDATKWTDDTKCKKVTLSTSNQQPNGTYVSNAGNYTNTRKYYATKVYKYSDDQDCKGYVNGATFNLVGTGLTTTTGGEVKVATTANYGGCSTQNGYAIYAMLESPSGWKVQETSPAKYQATVNCANGTTRSLLMRNTNGSSQISVATKEMTYAADGRYYCPSDFAGTNTLGSKSNPPVYYCLKIVKIDANTGERIKDRAKFRITGAVTKEEYTDSEGVATFLLDKEAGTYTATEIEAPEGYSLSSEQIQVSTTEMKSTTTKETKTDKSYCDVSIPDGVTVKSGNGFIKFPDTKLTLNWYKVSRNNNSEMLNGAKFKVKNSEGQYVTVKPAKEEVLSKDGTTKTCYIANGANATGSELESYNTQTKAKGAATASVTNGEVCVGALKKGKYTIEEIQPAQYHTFNNDTKIYQETSETFYPKVVTSQTSSQVNTFINCETEFELTKKVENDHSTDVNSEQYKKTTKELQKLKFNVYYGNTILKFKQTGDGTYEYASGVPNLTRSSDTVEDLVLNGNRKLNIKYLPWQYTYKIKEKELTGCKDLNQNACESQGFYLIKDSDSPDWTITTKSSNCASSLGGGVVTRDVTNTVTEINFTKKDIYSYFDGNTNSEVESKYENDEEYKLFDTIEFILKDKAGRRLKLEKVRDVGTCSLTSANNKTAYAEYRYVLDDGTTNTTEVIHTYCGNIKIKHLCRESEYTIEEISVPNESVFILPTPHPEVKFTTGKTKDTSTIDSETHIIENTPTRVVFQKRDLKYGNIISETVGQEKTTFNVYRCNEGIELKNCTPNTGTKIKFHRREVIKDQKDNEDYGKEVYRYPEKQTENNLIEDLHPYKGDLILRYLPGGEFKTNSNGEREYVEYNYILVETQAPEGYDTPIGGKEITGFKVNTSTVGVDVVNIANKPTKLILRKYDQSTGELLTGAKFKIYRVKDYDQNRALKNQDKEEVKLKTIRDGEYENRDNKDTYVITTCIKDCNLITNDLVTSEFTTTGIGQDELKTEIKEGEALIQYLEAENYYIVEEVEPKGGYELPDDNARYTLVYIPNSTGEADASVELYNNETVYQFYKFDEYNQLIDGAEFKLQKLDDNKKYHDVTVVLDEEKSEQTANAMVYRVNEETDNTTIITKNGSAMIYRLTEGQYRILEVKAPEGKELPKKTINVATFFVDKNGKVYGTSIITNKAPTDTKIYKPSASAEFIVDIKTGQNRIKYGIIIAVIIVAISSLIYFQNKKE